MFDRKNSRLLVWPLFIRGRMEHVGFKPRFRMACAEKIYEWLPNHGSSSQTNIIQFT